VWAQCHDFTTLLYRDGQCVFGKADAICRVHGIAMPFAANAIVLETFGPNGSAARETTYLSQVLLRRNAPVMTAFPNWHKCGDAKGTCLVLLRCTFQKSCGEYVLWCCWFRSLRYQHVCFIWRYVCRLDDRAFFSTVASPFTLARAASLRASMFMHSFLTIVQLRL